MTAIVSSEKFSAETMQMGLALLRGADSNCKKLFYSILEVFEGAILQIARDQKDPNSENCGKWRNKCKHFQLQAFPLTPEDNTKIVMKVLGKYLPQVLKEGKCTSKEK